MKIKRIPASRAFEAAQLTGLTEDWPRTVVSPNQLVRDAFSAMLARARHLHANHEQVKGWIDHRLPAQVLGAHGIQLQPRIRRTRGPELNTQLNRRVLREWTAWTRRGSCTMDGRISFTELQKTLLTSIARDGETIVQYVRGRQVPNRWGFALHVVEGEHLDVTFDYRSGANANVVMGVEVNDWRRPVGYWVRETTPNDFLYSFTTAQRRRVPASDVLHPFVSFYPSQIRGISWLHAAAGGGNQLQRYREAELIAARVAASKATILQAEDKTLAATLAGFTTAVDDAGETKYSLEEFVEPGSTYAAPPGWKATQLDPTHPNGNFGEFEKAVLRGMASSVGSSYHGFSGDLESVSYSSARQGAIDEREVWRDMQRWFAEHIMQPIFEEWLNMAVLGPLSDVQPSQIESILEGITWRPRGYDWIDPQKDAAASVLQLQHGLTTRSRILQERGENFEAIAEELAEEKTLLESLGLGQTAANGETGSDGTPGAGSSDESDEASGDADSDSSD